MNNELIDKVFYSFAEKYEIDTPEELQEADRELEKAFADIGINTDHPSPLMDAMEDFGLQEQRYGFLMGFRLAMKIMSA